MSIGVSHLNFSAPTFSLSGSRQQGFPSVILHSHDSVHFGAQISQTTKDNFAKFFLDNYKDITVRNSNWEPSPKWYTKHLDDMMAEFIERNEQNDIIKPEAPHLQKEPVSSLKNWVNNYMDRHSQEYNSKPLKFIRNLNVI